jgi:hypothetical protein
MDSVMAFDSADYTAEVIVAGEGEGGCAKN